MPFFWKFAASFICIGILIWAPNPALAQSPPPTENSTPETPRFASLLDYNQAKKTRDINVMWSLGGWAAANIVSGAIGWPLATDKRLESFHQMNLAWGVINLSIAIAAGLKARSDDPATHDLRDSLERAHTAQQAYLLNLGLDVAYLTAGALIWERGATDGSPLLEGYGWSLVMQGGVLLIFDAVMYALDSQDNGYLYGLIHSDRAGAPPRWEIGYAAHF